MKIYKILILLFLYKTNIVFGIIKTTDSIAALVNHHVILDSDIKKNFNIIWNNDPNFNQHVSIDNLSYQEILNQQITNNLIFNVAKQEKIYIEKNEIEKIIKDILYLYDIKTDQFQVCLSQLGLSYKQYYSQLYQTMINNIICERIVQQRVYIPPDEINEIIQIFNTIDYNRQFKIVHIVLPLPIQATEYQKKSIENLAKYLITNNKTKHNNNIIKWTNINTFKNNIFQIIKTKQTKWISWEKMPIVFDQYLQTIKIGDIIGPIYSQNNIHILKIKDIRQKKLIFPITKVKTQTITLKEIHNKNNIIKNLLEIKKRVESGDTTFNRIFKEEKLKNNCAMLYQKNFTWRNINNFDIETKKALIHLKKNEISTPIHTAIGWSLIQLVDINNINYSTMIRERAYYYLFSQKFNTIINNWIQELQSISYIKIFNKNEKK